MIRSTNHWWNVPIGFAGGVRSAMLTASASPACHENKTSMVETEEKDPEGDSERECSKGPSQEA